MDYHLRIAAVLVFLLLAFIIEFINGQNIAESSFLSRNKQERKTHNNPYDEFVAQRPSGAFHDIYTVLGQGGETQRVHYAVDDRGVRANIQSNSVHLGEKPDPASIFFGTRLNNWPSSSVIQEGASGSPPEQVVLPPPAKNQESFDPYGASQLPQLSGPSPNGREHQGEMLPSMPEVVVPTNEGRVQNPQLFIDGQQRYEPLRIAKPYTEAGLSEQFGEFRGFQIVNNPQLPENLPSAEKGNIPNIVPGFGHLVPFRPPQSPVLVEESADENLNPVPFAEVPVPAPENPYESLRSPETIDFLPRVEGLESYLTMFNKPVYDSRIHRNPVGQQENPIPVSQVPKSPLNPVSVVSKIDQYAKPLNPIPAVKSNVQLLKPSLKPTFPKVEEKFNTSVEKSQPERKIPSLFSVLSKAPIKSIAPPESALPGSLSFTKPITSSPMSTIFDSEKENGQYYHYIMNVGRKPGSNFPGRTKLYSTENGLYKILNQTGIHFQPDRITYTNKKPINVAGLKKVTLKPQSTTTKAKKAGKKKSTPKEFDLYTAGDVEDTVKAVEILPTTSSDQDPSGFKNASVDVMKEILHITNTEEPETEKSLPLVKVDMGPSSSSKIQNNAILTSEQSKTTSSTALYTESNATTQADAIQVPLYLTEPDPLDELMGNIQDGEDERDKENEEFIDALLYDYTTTPVQETTETQTTETTTSITTTTTESSTITRNPASSETTTPLPTVEPTVESIISSEHSESQLAETTTGAKEEVSSAETLKDNVTEVMVEVTNSNPTVQESDEKETQEQNSNKPMLELFIQNTEMNDFMSRINNMPIMIRVLNAQSNKIDENTTETTIIPETDESASKGEVLSTEPTTSLPNEESTAFSTTTLPTTITEASVTTATPQEAHKEAAEISTTAKETKAVTTQDIPKPVTTKKPKKTRSSKKISTKKNETEQKKEIIESSAAKPEYQESSLVETNSPLQYTLLSSENIGTEPTAFNTGLPDTVQMMGDMGFLSANDNHRSYADQRDTIILPMERSIDTIRRSEPLQLIPVIFEDDFHNIPRNERLVDYHDMSGSMYNTFDAPRNISLPAIRDTVNHSPYNLPPSVEYVDIMPYEELEKEGTPGHNYNPEAVMYLDNYDTLPDNSGNNQYVILGDINLEMPPGTEMYPLDTHVQQSALVPVKVSPKFGSRISP